MKRDWRKPSFIVSWEVNQERWASAKVQFQLIQLPRLRNMVELRIDWILQCLLVKMISLLNWGASRNNETFNWKWNGRGKEAKMRSGPLLSMSEWNCAELETPLFDQLLIWFFLIITLHWDNCFWSSFNLILSDHYISLLYWRGLSFISQLWYFCTQN